LIVIPEPTAQVVHFIVYSFYRIVIIIDGFNPSRFVAQPGRVNSYNLTMILTVEIILQSKIWCYRL
jgi:hypothetical protein